MENRSNLNPINCLYFTIFNKSQYVNCLTYMKNYNVIYTSNKIIYANLLKMCILSTNNGQIYFPSFLQFFTKNKSFNPLSKFYNFK